MINIGFFIVLGLLGGGIGYLLRIPMGTILGAMLAVGTGRVMGWITMEPSEVVTFLVQLALGIMIGLSFYQLNKGQLKRAGKGLLFIIIAVVFMTCSVAFMVYFFTGLDKAIAILSSAPGGMVEMATMAEALNLEAPGVIFLHFIRLLLVMLVFPYIISWGVKKWGRKG
ncbi:AbrB family transcriptional regulator [Bacillus sp. FJAT-44742]|uniref:AbrB family transcriptional regulator n=1 Tax=Bacillus sp. FJAT-44742 TaxID=2014005 RepID=UPI000C23BAB5|nr:AbrB family transcriptional regulator [Bacillus sp. FJAT-44742]